MSVTQTHAEYDAKSAVWKQCRDVGEGTRSVKGGREAYLARLSGQEFSVAGNAAYDAYLQRAMFFNGTARTVDAMTGAIMRKDMAVEGTPATIDEHLKDVTLTAVSLAGMAQQVVREVVNPGRYGVLVDLPDVVTATPRPYWVPYAAEQIVNWRTEVQDGDTVLVLVVLKECYSEPKGQSGDDRFVMVKRDRYRVCELMTPAAAAGTESKTEDPGMSAKVDRFCYQTIYEKARDADGKEATGPDARWVVTKGPTLLTRRGAGVAFIPFVFFNPSDLDPCPSKPPCEDLVDVNLGHYRNSADYEWGLHYVAIPTPWITGYEGGGEMTLGPTRAWQLPDPAAKVGMLEFTGTGLGQILNAMVEKRSLMAVLGGRMLEAQKATPEAADTVRLRQSGEGSVLASIAQAVSQGLTQLVQWHAFLAGSEETAADKAVVALNQDFSALTVTADTLKTLMLALQDGKISFETWYDALSKAELTRPGIDAEEELKAIEQDQTRAQGQAGAGAQFAPGDTVRVAPGMERDPAHAGQSFQVVSEANGAVTLRAPDGSSVTGYTTEELVPIAKVQPKPVAA